MNLEELILEEIYNTTNTVPFTDHTAEQIAKNVSVRLRDVLPNVWIDGYNKALQDFDLGPVTPEEIAEKL